MIGKTVRDYKIISKIGEGGMGIVYSAEHVHLEKKVAIKCLSPQLGLNSDFLDRFRKEAKAQANLTHPNIIQVNDFFEDGGQFFLVLEYVEGLSLDELIAQKGKLPEKEALEVFKDILRGLNFAHSKGIIHRDVKPSNIILTKDGTAKIMDFGIALMMGVERKTKTGMTIGTAHYMSPEQIKDPKNMDHRSDIYSAGIILYEMLAGRVPFDGDTEAVIYLKHLEEVAPDIKSSTEISPILEGILVKALEKNPEDRYAGCGEFLTYVEAYGNEQEIQINRQAKTKAVVGHKSALELKIRLIALSSG